ncbi:Fur family zinc uptake transcriptional regulator/Fur family ferric uptake transcriptional regulator [Natranaerovirga pectinivora]|uniref:Fur family zinc uptake transcriptional regulator/Fur family ferric uptake transcriptional regulator n=1 Tax=Natranaerovirga pectinivora TaxID=682400 RepID=A0A4R3MSX2_9FIRM|nr:Fur family transcriptional regulator [Natranaerovirga pectinivora]TCT16810.1 Fur family zinc uptake transcriptional regulator/Fur family ferric uptake transcriptional regulator [Natranaerovirga pectinivora]
MDLDQLLILLKKKGYKTTPQRKTILTVLLEQKDNLLTAQGINLECIKHKKNTNITTIYRNLELLNEFDLVHKVISDDGTAHYKLKCIENHHHHLICKGCGKMEVIDYCPIKILENLSESKSFTLTDHKLELYGYCKQCN